MSKELFRQAKRFIATLPKPVTPTGDVLSTTQLVSHAFDKAQEALEAGNKRLVMQHLAFAVDAVVNNIGVNDLDMEGVFSRMPALQDLDETFTKLFKQEVGRTLEYLVLYGGNIKNLYGMAKQGQSLVEALTRNEKVYRMVYSADSADDLLELVKCGGTYARMRLIVYLSTYEQELSGKHMAIFKSIQNEEAAEAAAQKHGDVVPKLMKLLGIALEGQQLEPKSSYNVTAHIRNSVGTMFDELKYANDGLQASHSFINYAGSPHDDVIEPIKKGQPNIFFMLNPIPDMTYLAAKPMVWGHALENRTPATSMTVVAPAMIPEFDN
ncbi:hypothetical protein ACSFBI_04905 [Variovorax sp. RB3P1]|uniref:hypothetical protein n=1 Tax=Variovorax sp. RB3P1 TaxID=3443732 RepID=UPI003F4535F3